MARSSRPTLSIDITLVRGNGIALDRQISQHIREAIANGHLRPGDHLPPIRHLANQLGIARATADMAYTTLIDEGYIDARPGRGSFVSTTLPINNFATDGGSRLQDDPPAPKSLSNDAQTMRDAFLTLLPQKNIPLAVISTKDDVSPSKDFAHIAVQTFKKHILDQVYAHPEGFPDLRAAIADAIYRLRAVRCKPEQVIVTSGSQLGLTMTLKVLFNRGDKVWFEDPCYPILMANARMHGIDPVHVPVDREGLMVEKGIEMAPDAKGVYVTPSHQCPLGMLMSLRRRRALIEWAKKSGAWIIEDDYDSELRYDGNLPFPSLQGMDVTGENIIYVGTFSKMLFSGLRLGYLIVPEKMVETFAGCRLLIDRQGNELSQRIVAEYISNNFYESHIRRMRTIFEDRRNYLMEIANKEIGDWGEFIGSDQGMHVVFKFHNQDIDDAAITRACLEEGVETRPVSLCYFGDTPRIKGLMLGFGFFDRDQIMASIHKIGYVLRSRFSDFYQPPEKSGQ